jgi:hypothetical protein
MQPIMSIILLFITSFDSPPFCRLLSIGCAPALPMGVAPEAIAKIFGYMLKEIDKLVPYTSSCVFCRLYPPLQWISPILMPQAPELKTRWTCASWQIFTYFLFSFPLFFTHLFFNTVIPFYYLHCKNPEIYFGPCRSRGPLVRAYK